MEIKIVAYKSKILGYSLEELQQDFFRYVDDDYVKIVLRNFKKALKGETALILTSMWELLEYLILLLSQIKGEVKRSTDFILYNGSVSNFFSGQEEV